MEEKLNPGLEPENVVEQATEELVDGEKKYTEEELNARLDELLSKKIARREAKIRREYENKFNKYKEAEKVLNAGMGTNNIEEATDNLRDFYSKKGIEMPQKRNGYSDAEENILAKAYADDIISGGYEEIVEEVDRLANKGYDNMSTREKAIFTKLAEARQNEESKKELSKLGVKADILEDKSFKEFRSMFDSKAPIKKVYEIYSKLNPQKEVEPIGSMRGVTEKKVKEFYTPEEARRLTSKDLDNPQIMAAVEKSMALWETQK